MNPSASASRRIAILGGTSLLLSGRGIAESLPPKKYRINYAGVEAEANLYPLDRPYHRFTEAERATLRNLYIDMPQTDEPPFPADGLFDVINGISRYAGTLKEKELLTVAVMVDESGRATGARLLLFKNIESAKAVAYFLVKEKFKPARCSGKPCAMEFPFRALLVPQ